MGQRIIYSKLKKVIKSKSNRDLNYRTNLYIHSYHRKINSNQFYLVQGKFSVCLMNELIKFNRLF